MVLWRTGHPAIVVSGGKPPAHAPRTRSGPAGLRITGTAP
ncbi:hypothetical protein RAJCM14343_4089 [Rhodococcus aetherivorans]|uniref:Uncharacterized protein n=1 Tax=Rhodococcus aetherivorans TaxID=191292 RepID=A0ABQ0YQT2_9NOCA|nr:hypothetical protein RAJCM14343_4089 [Rhodococcus aetherivorans]CCW11950.1 hypothetical protein EBESD8_24940 [Rhodococcus aetherivorans]